MRSLLAPVAVILLGSSLFAQYTPPVDVNAMLAGLKDLKQKQSAAAKSTLAQTISDFSNAATNDQSAVGFYMEAVRVTQFVGQEHEQTAFRDWRKKEEAKLNGPAIRTALRYTILSLQRAAGATDKQIFPVLLDYAQDTGSMISAIYDQEIVHQSVAANIFAKWYNLSDQLSGLDKWELTPGNIDGIYVKVLLPYMRKNRDPRIIAYWDKKIADETARAADATAAFATDRFNQTRRPQLLWSRAEDLIAIGSRDQGLTEMYTLVKNFPTHPDAGKWIDELEGLLAPPAVTGSGSAAAVPAPVPAK